METLSTAGALPPCRLPSRLILDDDFAGRPLPSARLALANGGVLAEASLLRVCGERPGEPLGLGTLLNSTASPRLVTYLYRGQVEVVPLAWVECIEVDDPRGDDDREVSPARLIMARLGLRSGRTLAGLLELPAPGGETEAGLPPEFLRLGTGAATVWIRRSAVVSAVAVGFRPRPRPSPRRRADADAEEAL